jgi:hypothetical protein
MFFTNLCGKITQRRSRRRVGVLQRQAVVRPGQQQEVATGTDGVVVEDERAGGGGEAVVQANSGRVSGVVLVQESLVAGLDESDDTKNTIVGTGGLNCAYGGIGGGGLESD